MTPEAPRPRPNGPKEPLQPRQPIEPVQPGLQPERPIVPPIDSLGATPPAPLGQGTEFLPGEILPELAPRRRRQRPSEDLSPEEKAEIIENRMLADDVNKERQSELMRTHGKTEEDLEADADAWLKAAGFDDLVEGKEGRDK